MLIFIAWTFFLSLLLLREEKRGFLHPKGEHPVGSCGAKFSVINSFFFSSEVANFFEDVISIFSLEADMETHAFLILLTIIRSATNPIISVGIIHHFAGESIAAIDMGCLMADGWMH